MTFLLLKQEMTQPGLDQRGSYIIFRFVGWFEKKEEEEKLSQANNVCLLNNSFSQLREKRKVEVKVFRILIYAF